MLDLDLTFPGHSRSKLIVTNERVYYFLSIISNKFGRICQCYQVTALGNMLDLDLTSPGHSRSKQMSPNERPYMYMPSYRSLIIHLAISARVSKLRPSEICLTSI